MVAIKKQQPAPPPRKEVNLLEKFAPTGIYNTPESREGIDFHKMVSEYVQRRRYLERDVSIREADRFVNAQYNELFQERPPLGMSAPFISCRTTSYLMIAHKMAEGLPISQNDSSDFRASWGEMATENNYGDFDEDTKLFFQAELLRRNDMAIAKKNDPALAAKAAEKKEAAAKEPKVARDMNVVWTERINRNTEKQTTLLEKNPNIYTDTGSRFRAETGRQTAFELAVGILKKKQKPMELDSFFTAFLEAAPEEVKKDGNYGPFVVGTHLDVFLVQDGTIILNPTKPEAVERVQEPTPEEKAAAKAAKAADKAAAKDAAKATAAAPVAAPKKAVILKKVVSPATA